MNQAHSQSGFPSGTNIRMLLQNCECEIALLQDAMISCEWIKKCLQQTQLTYLNSTHHHFDDGGYTLAIILSESHVVIHTWSEHSRLVLVELSICDFTRNNQDKARELAKAITRLFAAEKTWLEETGMIPRIAKPLATGHGFYVDMDDLLVTRDSAWQKIAVAKTNAFGTTLILDDLFQTTEQDHAFYHEPLVHVSMISHDSPKRVLICGGGDGGAAHQVLKHQCVEQMDIIEIDEQVVSISREHLIEVNRGSLDHEKVNIHITDAFQFLEQSKQKYDVILIDATNPVDEEISLFSAALYRLAAQSIHTNGIVGLHAGLPYTQPKENSNVIQNIHGVFENALPYLAFVPSFGTLSCFFLCMPSQNKLLTIEEVRLRLQQRHIDDLELFSPETMQSWFAIPPNLHHKLNDIK